MGDTPAAARKLWRQVRRQFDWAGLEALATSTSCQKPNQVKYLNAEKWLVSMCSEAVGLGLHTRAPIRILDIGSGAGYFPYLCNILGHDAWAMDQPSMPLFTELRDLMQVPFIEHAVKARQPLPASSRFDLVTAHRVQFNAKKGGGRSDVSGEGEYDLFDLGDWAFFFDDLRDHILRPGGSLILKMINQSDYNGLKFGDAPLMDYFASRGAHFPNRPGRYVVFDVLS